MNVQNAQRNCIWHFGVWYYIYFSRKIAFLSIFLYLFSQKNGKNVGYNFVEMTGEGAKHPGGETANGRNRRGVKTPSGEKSVNLFAQVPSLIQHW